VIFWDGSCLLFVLEWGGIVCNEHGIFMNDVAETFMSQLNNIKQSKNVIAYVDDIVWAQFAATKVYTEIYFPSQLLHICVQRKETLSLSSRETCMPWPVILHGKNNLFGRFDRSLARRNKRILTKLIGNKLLKRSTVPSILDMILRSRTLKELGTNLHPSFAHLRVSLPQ
jgi:hypothetical protein